MGGATGTSWVDPHYSRFAINMFPLMNLLSCYTARLLLLRTHSHMPRTRRTSHGGSTRRRTTARHRHSRGGRYHTRGGYHTRGCFTQHPIHRKVSRTPNEMSLNVHRSFLSQMRKIYPEEKMLPGDTGKYEYSNEYGDFFISKIKSTTESMPDLITRVLAYANALVLNGFGITQINVTSARRVNRNSDYYAGSYTTCRIVFKEYHSSGGRKRLPVHAKWWMYSTGDDFDKIDGHALKFRNTSGNVILGESTTSYTSLHNKIIGEVIGRRTGDSVFTVLWYCNRTDFTKKSICKSNK